MSIEYSTEVEQRPQYLNLEFFEEVAENALREGNLKLEKVRIEMGSKTGENYCSQIYRAKIQYKRLDEDNGSETVSVIVKSMPPSEGKEFLIDLQMFIKEKTTYLDVLPLVEVLIEGEHKFGARLYHHCKTPVNTLVFEDLCVRNFEMASREKGLDEKHCNLVMQRLGQFHGTSMVLAKKYPDLPKLFNLGMLAKAGLDAVEGTIIRYIGGNMQALIGLISKWPGYEKITAKIKKYASNLRENLLRSHAPLPGDIQVINHGDLWVNNILYKYDEQRKPQDVIFVDYQLSLWGSPGIDLNYFFYTSLELSILQSKREQLIKEYYDSLCSTLRRLSYDNVPSYQQIRDEVQRREPYGFYANFGVCPAMTLDKNSSKSLENLVGEEYARTKIKLMFQSKRLHEMLRYTLKHFDEIGVFD